MPPAVALSPNRPAVAAALARIITHWREVAAPSMAALILEEAILFGRNDGIHDPVAAAERLERAKVLTAPV